MSFLRCFCPQFDKVYQSGVSAVVNASGKLPQRKEVYEEFLMEVGWSKWGAPACSRCKTVCSLLSGVPETQVCGDFCTSCAPYATTCSVKL